MKNDPFYFERNGLRSRAEVEAELAALSDLHQQLIGLLKHQRRLGFAMCVVSLLLLVTSGADFIRLVWR